MYLLDGTADSVDRAVSRALRASAALVLDDLVSDELLTDVSRALLVNDVSDILVAEILKRERGSAPSDRDRRASWS